MCLLYSHLKRLPLTRTKHAAEIVSRHRLVRTLKPVAACCRCCSLTNSPFMKSSGRNCAAPVERRCTQSGEIFEATPGCVSCRQHVTGLNRSQARYESRQCLSKPGSNQLHHPPQGPSWKSLAPNNVLLLLLARKNNNAYENYHNHLSGSQLRGMLCRGCRQGAWAKPMGWITEGKLWCICVPALIEIGWWAAISQF